MNLGLDIARQTLNTYLQRVLPYCAKINPNWISLSLIPLGLLGAWIYTLAANMTILYFAGALIIFLRLALGSLDGMVAQKFAKVTSRGSLLGQLSNEFFDIAILTAIAYSAGENMDLGIWALAMGWASSYLGLFGMRIGKPFIKTGPVGQFERLLALFCFSILSMFFEAHLWIELFLWWCIFGGLLTSVLRIQQYLGDTSEPIKPPKS